VQIASDMSAGKRPEFEYMTSNSSSFAAYLNARANRHDDFFIRPAGGVDICNAPVPVRRKSS
jgi:peptidylprolyl isomerase